MVLRRVPKHDRIDPCAKETKIPKAIRPAEIREEADILTIRSTRVREGLHRHPIVECVVIHTLPDGIIVRHLHRTVGRQLQRGVIRYRENFEPGCEDAIYVVIKKADIITLTHILAKARSANVGIPESSATSGDSCSPRAARLTRVINRCDIKGAASAKGRIHVASRSERDAGIHHIK